MFDFFSLSIISSAAHHGKAAQCSSPLDPVRDVLEVLVHLVDPVRLVPHRTLQGHAAPVGVQRD